MPVGPDDPEFARGGTSTLSNTESLDYLSEIIAELKDIADRSGYRTLATILGAALVEVNVQRCSGEGRHDNGH
jgi:hypothetical protein